MFTTVPATVIALAEGTTGIIVVDGETEGDGFFRWPLVLWRFLLRRLPLSSVNLPHTLKFKQPPLSLNMGLHRMVMVPPQSPCLSTVKQREVIWEMEKLR